ncbi:unnamed protein product [Gadus morhua 'NCC']
MSAGISAPGRRAAFRSTFHRLGMAGGLAPGLHTAEAGGGAGPPDYMIYLCNGARKGNVPPFEDQSEFGATVMRLRFMYTQYREKKPRGFCLDPAGVRLILTWHEVIS